MTIAPESTAIAAPQSLSEGPVLVDPPRGITRACEKHRHCEGWMRSAGAGSAARLKAGAVLAFLLLAFAALSARLVQIQGFQSSDWKRKMAAQSIETQRPEPVRGALSIKTGSGELPLALNEPRINIVADLSILNDRDSVARQIAPLMGATSEHIYKQINRDDTHVVYLFRDMELDRADKIRALKIRGIKREDTSVRAYPQGMLACHLLGFAGMDGGQEGLEKGLETSLRGETGALHFYRDAARRLIAIDGDILAASAHPPHDGCSILLTIDARLQQAAEEQLAQIHDEFDPKAAT